MRNWVFNLLFRKEPLASQSYIKKIISGGQTGVDRAALDIAAKLKIPCGGWCPYGRAAEDGVISKKYHLKEAPAPTFDQGSDPDDIYKIRTELNARDSDGTLIIVNGLPIGGTLYTIEMLKKHKRPCIIFDLSKNSKIDIIIRWILENNLRELNVAGPRASQERGIYDLSYNILSQILTHKLLNQNQPDLARKVSLEFKLQHIKKSSIQS